MKDEHKAKKRFLEDKTTSDSKKRVPERRHYGLVNQGATCYLNSILQVLFVTPGIHDRFDPKTNSTDRELKKLFEKLRETRCGTESITRILKIENVYKDGDAAECLERILRQVSPAVSEIFEGKLAETTKCSKDHIINEEINPVWMIPLSLKDNSDAPYSVETGFERVFHIKTYKGNNSVFCTDCDTKMEAESGCVMKKFPPILTLLLKRFDFDYNTMSDVKSDRSVEVPFTINTTRKKYRLYGMVNHMGSISGGHYTATVQSRQDGAWYVCDDAHVYKVEEQPFTKSKTHRSRTAYLLMYRESRRDEVKQTPRIEEVKETFKPPEKPREEVKDQHEEPKRRRVVERETDKKNQKSVKTSSDKWGILKNPVVLSVIILALALVIILPVVLTSLNTG